MKYIIKTDIGNVRTENQDAAAVFSNKHFTLAILCDGMGGHVGGKIASKITIEVFEKQFNKKFPNLASDINDWYYKTIKKVKKEMIFYSKQNKNLLDMGTTITACIFNKEEVRIFNTGDSRTFVFNGVLHQVTKDHNLSNYYIENYNFSAEKAVSIIGADALTYALGPNKNITIDSYKLSMVGIESIILTSDGIHDYIAKPHLEKLINSDNSLEEKVNLIIKQAIKGRSSDNLTVVILEVP